MIAFVARRLGISAVVLFLATYVVYVLTCYAGDPTADLRGIPDDRARELQLAQRAELLHLDVNPFLRYFIWLRGAIGFVLPGMQGTLGTNNDSQDVGALLAIALNSSVRLVLTATLTAVVLGVLVGVVAALRQYSAFDYTTTVAAFVLYSLPVFWIAVLLKQYGAIWFNDWLADPAISFQASLVIAIPTALLLQTMLGGDRRRRLVTSGVAVLAVLAVTQYLSATRWFANPALGVGAVVVGSAAIALAAAAVTAGLARRDVLYSSLATAAVGAVAYFATGPVLIDPTWWHLLALLGITAAVCVGIGWTLGGLDRGPAVAAALITGLLTGALIFLDHLLRAVPDYARMVGGRLIPTVQSQTPGFEGDFWERFLDVQLHVWLPTLAIVLVSFASYTRYTRTSMLDVMNQDYVRTARAKGLTEHAVVTRHVLRNALIPVTTVVAYDLAAIIGGAVIAETVFGWSGMGQLFITGLDDVNPDPVMAFFLVTGGAVVVLNLLADLAYAWLDPRIRLTVTR